MTFESLGKEKGARRICGRRKEARPAVGRLNCTDVNRPSESLSCRSPSIAIQPSFGFRSLRICEAGMRAVSPRTMRIIDTLHAEESAYVSARSPRPHRQRLAFGTIFHKDKASWPFSSEEDRLTVRRVMAEPDRRKRTWENWATTLHPPI